MQFLTFLGKNREKFFINETIKGRDGQKLIWAVNGDDRSNGPTCSEAHKTLKKRKIDAWGWQF